MLESFGGKKRVVGVGENHSSRKSGESGESASNGVPSSELLGLEDCLNGVSLCGGRCREVLFEELSFVADHDYRLYRREVERLSRARSINAPERVFARAFGESPPRRFPRPAAKMTQQICSIVLWNVA